MSNGATDPNADQYQFDPELLDRMIGAKGDAAVIEAKCQSLQSALCGPLEQAFEMATNVKLTARPGDIQQGSRRQLLAVFGQDAVFCDARIDGFSQDISALCGTKLVIAMVECLLGGSDPEELDVAARPLSGIELDMSLVVFEQLNDTLRDVASKDPTAKASAGKPLSSIPEAEDDPKPDFHAAAITLDLQFGSVIAPLTLILPQSILLKTKPISSKNAKQSGAVNDEWAESLNARVSRSEINLQAAVAMAPLPVGEISRLQVGDLIGFADTGDIEVTLSANGKALYTCALGKSGARYMVKVEGDAGPDENWRSDFS
jgi:flagellar motor switch protein FliM